jgi:hypothetical protein
MHGEGKPSMCAQNDFLFANKKNMDLERGEHIIIADKLERPIAFYPFLARALGDIESAIFYQQLHFWSDKGDREDGWIYKSKKDIEEETTLSRKQQDRIKNKLVKMGWIETKTVKAKGAPTIHYLCKKGFSISTKGTYPKVPKGPLDKSQRDHSSYTENTTENTTESTDARAPKISNSLFFEEVKNWEKGKVLADQVVSELTFFADTTGLSRSDIWKEVQKFTLYWTEKNPTGKKERWELQTTFEVRRRLLTWFTRAFASVKTNLKNNKPKFI